MTESPTEVQPEQALLDAVRREALCGLNVPTGKQKLLSPWLFYDARGSELFERITELPEYYLTRTERGLFEQMAEWLPLHLIAAVTVAELGAGSAEKTGVLLRAFAAHQNGVLYQPIDISASALEEAAAKLAARLPEVTLAPQVANYVTDRYNILRPEDHAVLAMYIGSSIGNFSPEEAVNILANLRAHLEPGDTLLLGVDLAPSACKPVARLLAAYDDAAGVTAAFNRNVLFRLNREAAADFDPSAFAHRAVWNAAESRMEMHLVSLQSQRVHVAGQEIHFTPGETIHTENSYKFTRQRLNELLHMAGFQLDQVVTDPEDFFAVTLAEAM